MEPTDNSNSEDVIFNMGKDKNADTTKQKKKKPEDVGEERLKNTFNVGGASSKDNDEHKRKREEFAV